MPSMLFTDKESKLSLVFYTAIGYRLFTARNAAIRSLLFYQIAILGI
jgi:hypothetical protein